MGQDPDAIRHEIAETRARMDDTIDAIGYKADVPTRTRERITDKVDTVKSKVSGITESVTGKASAVTGTVSDKTSTMTDSVSGKASDVGGAMSGRMSQLNEATPSAQDVKQGARKAVGIAQENPLGLTIGAAAIGFIAGLMAPSTRIENERIGPMADQVKDTVRETGQQALEHGKTVAQEVASTAKEQAQSSVSEIKDQAQSSAQEHGQAMASTAKDQASNVGAPDQQREPTTSIH